ncbi:MAG: 50S ribosomal protein L22 [Alphaproteobacteria bacterium]|nr:50S ribosomal protein L22 [Alphaproteobacteria bacterium]
MGQKQKERREAPNEAKAEAKYLRTSDRKLNLVAQMIRGKSAAKALTDLQFSQRRIAKDVRKVLASAVANAENNHGLDVDRLIVAEAYVGKSIKMRRIQTRGRGRAAPIEKPFSRLTVIVRELGDDMVASKKAPKKKAPATTESAAKKPAAKKAPAKKAAAKKEQE